MGRRFDAPSGCWGKMPYATRSEALAVMALVRAKIREQLKAYRCQECQQWHIGHPERSPDRRIDRKRFKNWHWRKETDI